MCYTSKIFFLQKQNYIVLTVIPCNFGFNIFKTVIIKNIHFEFWVLKRTLIKKGHLHIKKNHSIKQKQNM